VIRVKNSPEGLKVCKATLEMGKLFLENILEKNLSVCGVDSL